MILKNSTSISQPCLLYDAGMVCACDVSLIQNCECSIFIIQYWLLCQIFTMRSFKRRNIPTFVHRHCILKFQFAFDFKWLKMYSKPRESKGILQKLLFCFFCKLHFSCILYNNLQRNVQSKLKTEFKLFARIKSHKIQ